MIPTDSVDLAPPNVSLGGSDEGRNGEPCGTATVERGARNQSDRPNVLSRSNQTANRSGWKLRRCGTGGIDQHRRDKSLCLDSSSQVRDRVNLLSINNGLPPLPDLPIQTISPDLIGGYGQSIQSLIGNRYSNYRVGIQINLPLRNRTAKAQLGRSLVEGQRIAAQREQLEQSIQVEVQKCLAKLCGVWKQGCERLRRRVGQAEQQYASEQRKLDAGQSTVFLVLERQTALTTARGNELRAQTDLNKASAELQRATGNALTGNSIVVRR